MSKKLPKSSKKTAAQTPLFSSPFASTLVIGFLVAIILGVLFLGTTKPKQVCANAISCITDLSGKFDPSAQKGEFMGQIVSVPKVLVQDLVAQPTRVLGDATSSNKHIYVDLTNQMLYAKEGDQTIYQFAVSTGKWGKTPTGDFKIWIKLRYTRMKGGSVALHTYYNLPNVPYTMYFYNNDVPKSMGYGIHGAYWHNNFGHPMSHGCINMRTEEVEKIYNWANPATTGFTTKATDENPGTPITIYGTAPNE